MKNESATNHTIILTSRSVQQIRDFVPMEYRFKFEQLSRKSQEIVLDKKIDFQGCEVTLRSVLQRHGTVQHVLGPELVKDLITEGTAVNIGRGLQGNEGYYAARVLERNIWLYSNDLKNSTDVFFVSGTTREDLLKIVPSCKIVECIWSEEIKKADFTKDMRRRIIVLSENVENSFLAIC
jgi:hypothetical protein